MPSAAVERLRQAGVFADPELVESVQRENWARGMEVAVLHAQVFNTDAGRKLLDLWVQQVFVPPIVRPHESERADGIREGRADMVRQVLVQLEIAHSGQLGVKR